jgi:hypothetical protein
MRAHDGKGRFIRHVDTVERDAQACRMRSEGYTYTQVAEELGYYGKNDAHRAVQRALMDVIQEPAEELLAIEVMRAQERYLRAKHIVETDSPVVSHGKIVYDDAGRPLIDHMQKLAALDRMERAADKLAKLCGLYAPKQVEILTMDVIQAEIRRLEESMTAREQGAAP